MDLAEFTASLGDAAPPAGTDLALQALWWAGKGDWQRAHALAQEGHDQASDLVHAWLHRQEGDLANAGYWYRRVGRSLPQHELQVEWGEIARELVGRG
jgi:hypothetical protein